MHLPSLKAGAAASSAGRGERVLSMDEAELAKVMQTVTGLRGAMHYTCKVGAAPDQAARVKEIVDGMLAHAEQVFSLWVPESEVNKINKAPRAEPVELSADMAGVLLAVQKLHGVTKGVYDPACYPLWRYFKRWVLGLVSSCWEGRGCLIECVFCRRIFLTHLDPLLKHTNTAT